MKPPPPTIFASGRGYRHGACSGADLSDAAGAPDINPCSARVVRRGVSTVLSRPLPGRLRSLVTKPVEPRGCLLEGTQANRDGPRPDLVRNGGAHRFWAALEATCRPPFACSFSTTIAPRSGWTNVAPVRDHALSWPIDRNHAGAYKDHPNFRFHIRQEF
jgi:hypothetical protein